MLLWCAFSRYPSPGRSLSPLRCRFIHAAIRRQSTHSAYADSIEALHQPSPQNNAGSQSSSSTSVGTEPSGAIDSRSGPFRSRLSGSGPSSPKPSKSDALSLNPSRSGGPRSDSTSESRAVKSLESKDGIRTRRLKLDIQRLQQQAAVRKASIAARDGRIRSQAKLIEQRNLKLRERITVTRDLQTQLKSHEDTIKEQREEIQLRHRLLHDQAETHRKNLEESVRELESRKEAFDEGQKRIGTLEEATEAHEGLTRADEESGKERNQSIKVQEENLEAHVKAIAQRDKTLQSMQKELSERDKVIAAQAKSAQVFQARGETIQQLGRKMADRNKRIQVQQYELEVHLKEIQEQKRDYQDQREELQDALKVRTKDVEEHQKDIKDHKRTIQDLNRAVNNFSSQLRRYKYNMNYHESVKLVQTLLASSREAESLQESFEDDRELELQLLLWRDSVECISKFSTKAKDFENTAKSIARHNRLVGTSRISSVASPDRGATKQSHCHQSEPLCIYSDGAKFSGGETGAGVVSDAKHQCSRPQWLLTGDDKGLLRLLGGTGRAASSDEKYGLNRTVQRPIKYRL